MVEDKEAYEFSRAYNARVAAMIARDLANESRARERLARQRKRERAAEARARNDIAPEDEYSYYWEKF